MSVKCIITGALMENTYVYLDENSMNAVIIDPGDDYAKIVNYIEKTKVVLVAVLLTHAHYDHFASAQSLTEKYNLPVMVSIDEESVLANSYLNLSDMFNSYPISIMPDKTFLDGDIYSFDDKKLTVIATPGHSPGGVCYYSPDDKILFSGDTLFHNSIGRTDFEYSSFQQIIDSITKKLMLLPDDTIVYPGHGISTTIGAERKNFDDIY